LKIIIQKFGGTSLQNAEIRNKAADHVANAIKNGYSPVVVVSAMGRDGDPYATDTLLKTITSIHKEISLREKDMIMSCGEVISAVTMVQTLKQKNINAIALNGIQAGIITDENFGQAKIQKVIPEKLFDTLNKGLVPVVTGFQGISENGEITTFCRGGSDTTASILAAALEAKHIEIYSDVDGLATADPNKISGTSQIPNVNYIEAVEMADKGANIIHPHAVEIASQFNIPIMLFSTLSNNDPTMITNLKNERPVTVITSENKIIYTQIFPQEENIHATELSVFQILAEQNVSVDFIDITPELISFIVDDLNKDKLLQIVNENNYYFNIKKNFSKVSVVGSGMTGMPGVMSKIVKALTDRDITIYKCTDSYTTISCLVKSVDEKKAISALHEEFELGEKNV